MNKPPYLFCVGPSVPSYDLLPKGYQIVHRPYIQLISLPTAHFFMKKWYSMEYDGIIITSSHAAYETKKLLCRMRQNTLPRYIFSVGLKTTRAIEKWCLPHYSRKNLPIIMTSSVASQEGIVDLIINSLPTHTKLFWPHSLDARRYLQEQLVEKKFFIEEIPLYLPLPKQQKSSLFLQSNDIVYFSCSSSVHAFFKQHPIASLPHIFQWQAIGPITQKTVQEYMRRCRIEKVIQNEIYFYRSLSP